jgi:hypothetical protein
MRQPAAKRSAWRTGPSTSAFLALGKRLADMAFRQHAELYLRFPRFEFVVADKADAGSASSAGGTVVIYRGVRRLNLDDAALAFVLAREMSHVIAGHHDENVTTSILVAVAAQILFPVLNLGSIFSGSAAATSAAASTAATASGYDHRRGIGRLVRRIACLARQLSAAAGQGSGSHGHGTAGRRRLGWARGQRPVAVDLRAPLPDGPGWTVELHESAQRIASLMQGPPMFDLIKTPRQIVPISVADLPPPLISVPY